MTSMLATGLRSLDGALRRDRRWLGPATHTDHAVLDRAIGPVLDIGCGPGRHALALAEREVPTLGLDVTERALAIARARGVPVLERSVFDRIPLAGRWRTALLLDGNIGIDANPVVLLQRVAMLLAADGRVLAELEAPGESTTLEIVRLELDGTAGPWFRWSSVAVDEIASLAPRGGFTVADAFVLDARWFAELTRD